MEKRKMSKLYDLLIELQRELENDVENVHCIHSSDQIRALAATYQLQDFLASELA